MVFRGFLIAVTVLVLGLAPARAAESVRIGLDATFRPDGLIAPLRQGGAR